MSEPDSHTTGAEGKEDGNARQSQHTCTRTRRPAGVA